MDHGLHPPNPGPQPGTTLSTLQPLRRSCLRSITASSQEQQQEN